ncbi:UvrD-helicase domain-containing protein [Holdemanella porci]|uniref:UvrD-helicase domain-containing protein n=1 Tax=Holdemanella porci TaxID=2652276 RepID=UPI003AB1F99A
MIENEKKYNYLIAKEKADQVDKEIIQTLQDGESFRVEAGAGSGKTYSLNRVIEWIQTNKWNEYVQNKQSVICITYTNAAVDVIKERLTNDSFIVPSTIHSFAWNSIKQYQSELVRLIKEDSLFKNTEGDFDDISSVNYTLGNRYKENGEQYLYHNDVLHLFCKLLDNSKFRRIFAGKYPLILIDEYQDSNKKIIDKFIEYFISKNKGPQFGFFGDAWQTIYQSNDACGKIEHRNIKEIKKNTNFRCAPNIVYFLNKIRPELPQNSAIDDFDGEIIVVHCNDFTGERRDNRYYKGDLPVDELKVRLDKINDKIKNSTPTEETTKVLMLTHKLLAQQQGYSKLLEVLDDGLRDKQDIFLLYFMNIVEPIYEALNKSNMQLLFDTLGVRNYPITKKSDKLKWKNLKKDLEEARRRRAIDVLNVIYESKLIPVPPKVEVNLKFYKDKTEIQYGSNTSLKEFLELEYSQFLSAINFLYPDSDFSTEHGVKGEEYDNVIFVISKGWNQYQFEKYIPMITGDERIQKGKDAAFERNRNLFYVCCSRPKKRLIFFITVPMDQYLYSFFEKYIGKNNIYTYSKFLDKH